MTEYHVHVYKVVAKIEINVNASTEKEAMEIALLNVKEGCGREMKSDCSFIVAGCFPAEEQKGH